MTGLAHWKAEQARVWGSAAWQNIAESVLSAVHEELVTRLAPRPGDPWLDVATGTGAVALRAARLGAEVSALDLSPALVRTARRLSAKKGLAVRFDIGDAERLPYPDASFDIVSSAHGVVLATDHAAVARELARVCRIGGRLGLTYWLPNQELERLMERIGNARPANADNPRDWREPRYVNGLLSSSFQLAFVEAPCSWIAESGEAAWRLFIDSDGPAKIGVAALPPEEREALHRDWVDYFERHRRNGAVRVPRPYLLILGRRHARSECSASSR
jgi:SAM-dependent methyltransferase